MPYYNVKLLSSSFVVCPRRIIVKSPKHLLLPRHASFVYETELYSSMASQTARGSMATEVMRLVFLRQTTAEAEFCNTTFSIVASISIVNCGRNKNVLLFGATQPKHKSTTITNVQWSDSKF